MMFYHMRFVFLISREVFLHFSMKFDLKHEQMRIHDVNAFMTFCNDFVRVFI